MFSQHSTIVPYTRFHKIVFNKEKMVRKSLDLGGNLKMPTIGLGTFLAKDEKELETAVNTALEVGYRHIDTAWVYENERIIGKVLKGWFNSGKLKRDDIFITTKLSMIGVHPDRVEIFLKKSLENLQLDYVDLYLIHFPIGSKVDKVTLKPLVDAEGVTQLEGPTDHEAVWKKMEEQVVAKRTKAIGLSNFNKTQISRILKSARIKPANLQIEVHAYLQQNDLVDYCQQNGITVTAYAPLGAPAYKQHFKIADDQGEKSTNILGDELVRKLAKKYSKTPAQIALRFLLQRNIIIIPKSVTPARIKENFEVYDFQINDDDMRELKKLDVGDKARIFNMLRFKGFNLHPDFPFKSA